LVLRDQGDFVRIRVTDDGPGMTPEVRERVFDPFFTTKAPGRGTGLGLSTAYAAIARVGGRMECQSKVGGGTTFSLFVPVHVETDDAVSSARAAPRPSSNGHELRVLVVDDEDIVRRALVSVLSQGGLQVVGARDAAEALEIVQRIEFDVALLDRTMPGMDGIRLAAELHKSHPELRLVLVTGGEVGSHEVMHFEQVMTKPVRSANLLEVVQRLGRKAN
ncbi:MAG TPA: response regulator, partial [Polyangiaceae bacterium]|nr:response regulator [Polyangiaceae bacterium]